MTDNTGVVLFTRDLRVHDNPAVHEAAVRHQRVVPLFVFDDRIFASGYAVPNRVQFLLDSLRDLRTALSDRGGALVVRRGDVLAELRDVIVEVGASAVHVAQDVSRYAQGREGRLRKLASDLGIELVVHPGILVVPPGEIQPSGGDVFKVFTPYWRKWQDAPKRRVLPPPDDLATPTTIATGGPVALRELVDGVPSPHVERGGEERGRTRLDAWFGGEIEQYDERRDDLDRDTSRLSAHLHFGTVSPNEVASRCDRRRTGHEPFLRELCWRDYNHQLTWAHPDVMREDIRSQGDRWRDEDDAIAAWKEGRTGYPIVDAAMRQLTREGYMHNRARLIVASFLTKHLYVDWRIGAQHFLQWLVDGDVANNSAQWQWTAGTGTDSRPNRMFNPMTQSRRYNAAPYIRRYVPELAELSDGDIHEPWTRGGSLLDGVDYPPPIVDHADARERFLTARKG